MERIESNKSSGKIRKDVIDQAIEDYKKKLEEGPVRIHVEPYDEHRFRDFAIRRRKKGNFDMERIEYKGLLENQNPLTTLEIESLRGIINAMEIDVVKEMVEAVKRGHIDYNEYKVHPQYLELLLQKINGQKYNTFGSSVVNWRTLVVNEDIHYCENNDTLATTRTQVVKREGKWLFKSNQPLHTDDFITAEQMIENADNNHYTEIKYCPYCAVDLMTYVPPEVELEDE